MKRPLRTIGILALAAAAVGAGVAAWMAFLGGYNVAATDPHLRATVWLLDTAMRSSVRRRSAALAVPPLDDPRRIAAGAAVYRTHCETCHGGPGVAPAPFALGLVPLPANLAHTAREWPPRWLFWVIKHGIKMTAMPAWEYRLSDDEIWAVVAFLPAMAHMAPAEYRALAPPALPRPPVVLRAPDPERGRRALHQYACATCHLIPGVAASRAPVGPPLDGMARRQFIAGVLPNNRENLVRWLRAPQQIDPRSAMPALGLSEQDAADIAAYLQTLD